MDNLEKNKYRQAKELIDNSLNILLIAHKKPDGDALGSTCAMRLALDQMQKESALACVDEVPINFLFLPEATRFVQDFQLKKFDLIITLDCGASYMTKYHEKYPDIFTRGIPVINFDHHPSNDNFGTINIVNSSAAATAVVILDFLKFIDVAISRNIATCLLTGIYTDTGSFMHSNTSSEIYRLASSLLSLGANLGLIVKNAFKNTSINTLRLWGRVLNNLKINNEGITLAVATKDDFTETETTPEDLSGVIDIINSIPNTKFALLLNEGDNGNVKGSFRTQMDDVDLSQVAGIFGGGGHKKAAGFTIPGKLEQEIRWKIVPEKNNESIRNF